MPSEYEPAPPSPNCMFDSVLSALLLKKFSISASRSSSFFPSFEYQRLYTPLHELERGEHSCRAKTRYYGTILICRYALGMDRLVCLFDINRQAFF